MIYWKVKFYDKGVSSKDNLRQELTLKKVDWIDLEIDLGSSEIRISGNPQEN